MCAFLGGLEFVARGVDSGEGLQEALVELRSGNEARLKGSVTVWKYLCCIAKGLKICLDGFRERGAIRTLHFWYFLSRVLHLRRDSRHPIFLEPSDLPEQRNLHLVPIF